MRKRFYILFVARDADGQLRKIPIPIHYVYVLAIGALLCMFTITGMAGCFSRLLMKVARFNELRTEKEQIKNRYSELELVSKEKDIQVASLGSIASEVSTMYCLKSDSKLIPAAGHLEQEQVQASLDQLYALRSSAESGVATAGLQFGVRNASLTDWARASQAPTLWPVDGCLSSSFGERIDPFNGDGALHRSVDFS